MHHHNLADFDGDGQFDATDIVIFTEKSSKLSSSRNPEGQHVAKLSKEKTCSPAAVLPICPELSKSPDPQAALEERCDLPERWPNAFLGRHCVQL
jgi:hypothetical protein